MPKHTNKSETREGIPSKEDEIHTRIQSKLNALRTDFKQLETDLRVANQESSRAREDRIQGFKRAPRDLLDAMNRVERVWH